MSFLALFLFFSAPQTDAANYNREGITYHQSNQLRAAETAYNNALKLQPDYAEAQNNLAVVYYSQRKFSDADNQIRRAVEKNPDNAVMRMNLRAARYARDAGS